MVENEMGTRDHHSKETHIVSKEDMTGIKTAGQRFEAKRNGDKSLLANRQAWLLLFLLNEFLFDLPFFAEFSLFVLFVSLTSSVYRPMMTSPFYHDKRK